MINFHIELSSGRIVIITDPVILGKFFAATEKGNQRKFSLGDDKETIIMGHIVAFWSE